MLIGKLDIWLNLIYFVFGIIFSLSTKTKHCKHIVEILQDVWSKTFNGPLHMIIVFQIR